ncbi:WXG100 family type VII secretion target [Nocardia xishanensis]|uniref:WXG100 family type VII secretion target n=1 Tax=Nocardia xishanensis TaxID=238964 RepID=UPI00083381F1|nr:WXG100 family type VII secretion target [Nocardia xishanensis]
MDGNVPNVSVVPEDVQDVGRFAYRVATELRSGAAMLDNEVTALLASWKGSSATSYADGWREMHAAALQVWDELFELAEKLGITADTYRQRDTGTAGAFSSLNL